MSAITPPETINPLAKFVDECLNALMSGGEVALEAYVTAQIPIMANPVLQDVLDNLVSTIGAAVYVKIADYTNSIVFDIQTNGENAAIIKAANAGGGIDADSQSTEDLINGYGNLIHNDGTNTP